MEITLTATDAAPVLTLRGRFDGNGARVFDEFVQPLEAESWILDFSGVPYLSSMGLRSLMSAEKRLRQHHGGLVLVAMSPFVRQVLEMAQLQNHFRCAASVVEALSVARTGSVAPDRALRKTRGNRAYAFWPLAGRSVLETWGSPPDAVKARLEPEFLGTFTLEDLGFAVGTGGFGGTREQAAEAIGLLVTAPRFAGLAPADIRNAADFILPQRSADAVVHVASALGFSGSPSFALQISGNEPFSAADLVADMFAFASEHAGAEPAVLAVVVVARLAERDTPAILVGVGAGRPVTTRPSVGFEGLSRWIGNLEIGEGRTFTGSAILLSPSAPFPSMSPDPDALIPTIASLDTLEDLTEVHGEWRITAASAWGYCPVSMREGREKLLTVDVEGGAPILDEWESIARRLYRDCRRIVLTPLHGGFMSNTFRVTSYDADARRMLPTVLKIGALSLTEREERANRKYVQTFILNNSTTILGGAAAGEWAGLRYNFLGINGPDSSLTWLREHYKRRPVDEVVPLIDAVFTRILKPWYGQPRWEPVALYREHDPRRLFPTLCDIAAQELGVSPDTERLPCPELGTDLLNPYYFLQHEYSRRQHESRLWYTSICHGDLNMQNILLDERENIYVIDFSETRPRNIVSDLARMEPILKFEMIPVEDEADLRRMLEFERGLLTTTALNETPPNTYPGTSPPVEKAYQVIRLLRRHANTVTIFETDIVPYWLALLEWTLPVIAYRQLTAWQKKYAAYSAALLCEAIVNREAA